MKALLIILGVLFLTLMIVVLLLERFSSKGAGETKMQNYSSLGRLIFPLMAVLIIAQMVRYWLS